MLKNFTPANGAKVSLLNEHIRIFYRMYKQRGEHFSENARPWVNLCRDEDGTRPMPVILSWNTDIEWPQYDFKVHLAENADFSDERIYPVPKEGTAIRVYNLAIGRKYYWYVENGGERAEKSEVTAFETADEFPRAIYLDPQVINIRDVGGLYNIDGRRVRQGVLFRGANIDRERTPGERGFARLVGELGVRTDIDLRGNDFKEPPERHPLAQVMRYELFPLGGYEDTVTNDRERGILADLFRLMCDESVYPALIHCGAGTDRTGTAAFLLGLALRIDVEMLALDYEISSLSLTGWEGRNRRPVLAMGEAICRYGDEKDDIYAAAEKFFDKGLHLPAAPQQLRRIFLEE